MGRGRPVMTWSSGEEGNRKRKSERRKKWEKKEGETWENSGPLSLSRRLCLLSCVFLLTTTPRHSMTASPRPHRSSGRRDGRGGSRGRNISAPGAGRGGGKPGRLRVSLPPSPRLPSPPIPAATASQPSPAPSNLPSTPKSTDPSKTKSRSSRRRRPSTPPHFNGPPSPETKEMEDEEAPDHFPPETPAAGLGSSSSLSELSSAEDEEWVEEEEA